MSVYGIAALQGGLNVLGSLASNIFGANAAHEARQENYELNEESAKNADARTRRLYEDLQSPSALLKQYKEAGLSPSLMFGGEGIGGQITHGAQGAGSAGVSNQVFGIPPIELANIELMKSQARKNNAEAEVTEETKDATIANILADTGLKNASTAVQNAEKAGIELDNYVKTNTKEASIYTICELAEKAGHDAEKAYAEMISAQVLATVDQNTYNEQIQQRKLAVQQLAQSIIESKSLVSLNEMKKRELYNNILQAWEQIDINWKTTEIEQQKADTYQDWINKQIEIIDKQIDIKLKELGIEKTRVIVDGITESIRALSYGAMAVSSFKPGKGGNLSPNAKDILKPKYDYQSNYKDRKYKIMEQNEPYSW